jgi:hypothetical protein
MADSGVFEELFRALEKNPAPRWIFGEPVTLGARQVVPVSEFHLVVELPSPVAPAVEGQVAAPAAASAAALRLDGNPLGFLDEQEGRVVFVPIQVGACADANPSDEPPAWVDDLFRRLDDVRLACERPSRELDDACGRGRYRSDRDDDLRERRPRRDADGRD